QKSGRNPADRTVHWGRYDPARGRGDRTATADTTLSGMVRLIVQQDGTMQPGDGNPPRPRRPTMVDVALQAGVSLKTVSRVINGEPSVAPILVDRVLTAASELGFRRNDVARSLRSSAVSRTIGLLIEEIANPFYAVIAGVVAEIAAAHDTLLII